VDRQDLKQKDTRLPPAWTAVRDGQESNAIGPPAVGQASSRRWQKIRKELFYNDLYFASLAFSFAFFA